MDAVGKLGSYISRGVVTVSAPFHPFGGAVDIIVVEQPDGSLKSSPWYVQFGKFQGVLKAREKVVSINVNGVDADFRMYLDSKGRAHFLKEVVEDEVMSESIGSSGDNTDQSSSVRRPEKILSCNSELQRLKRVSEFEASNQKKMTRSNTTGPRVLGFVFGRRSWKEKRLLNRANVVGWDRKASLEHAEMAADLLELRWSTGLPTRKHRKDIALCNSDPRFCIHGDNRSEVDSCRPPQSSCFHDKGEAEILLSTSPVNYMESFTLEETYLDVDFTECSVGSSGGDTGDVKRMQRVESSIYCDTSESFMDRLDGSSGESSESLSCSVSGEMDVPTEILGGEQELISNVHSGLSSRILVCEVDVNGENMEDKGLCRSIDGSKSCSVADSDVETVLETKVDVESNTTESPVKHVEEIVVNQIPSNEEPSLTNSCVIEEVTCSVLDSKENLRSEKPSIPASTDLLLHMGSCENIDSPVASMNESSRNAFQVDMTNAVIPEKTGEQFLSNFDSSEVNSIVSVPFTSTDSLTKEINFQDFGKSCEDVRKPNETQFFFSDVHGSELTKTMDMQLTTLDSLEAEIDPQYCPKSSEEKLGESTKMLNESHSFTGQLIQEDHLHDDQLSSPDGSRTISSPISINRVQELAEQTAQTVESLPSFCSHYSVMNDQGSNCLISHSLDLSSDNMRLAHGDVPTTLETGELNGQSTLRQSSTEHMQITEELRKILSNPAVEISFCRHLLYEGMGQEAAAQAFDAEKLDFEKLVSLSSDVIRNDRVVVRIGGLYFPWDAALPIISAIGSPTGEQILEPNGMITIDLVENGAEREPQQSIDSSNSGPSIATIPTDSERCIAEETDTLESASIRKKMEWSKTPTSEQLASLNLKKGKNEVIFTFSSPVLGEQKVDARIYLWKWNARIVVSDVDGTITKSDVLGQFMPLVGVDWSQTGVAHLFSAIKENGYELLFLSARAISQASLTRQFLFNLKQEGKALPEGPVVISPDGLFPSLIREVIRRAPHEFKIACLEDIRALFPPDHNPFYAGFGNRDTDELSYLKVGMPKGKIFIINPKGEVAVQRRVDRKTYKSLHTVVHDMFPPPSSASSPEQEDFNSWNFWRLPPPEVV